MSIGAGDIAAMLLLAGIGELAWRRKNAVGNSLDDMELIGEINTRGEFARSGALPQ